MEAALTAGGMQTVGVRGRRMRLTLLPPPVDRHVSGHIPTAVALVTCLYSSMEL